MARLTDDKWEQLEADWHTGAYSKNQLATKYELSHTAVNKRLKSVEPKFQALVSTQIAIKSELSNQSCKQVSAIETVVAEAIRNKNLVFGVTHKALEKASKLLDSTENMYDINTAIQLADRASLTLGVNQRHSTSQVNIQNNQNIEPTKIVREIIDVAIEH